MFSFSLMSLFPILSYYPTMQVCSKRFARSDHLDKHIKIHSRDRTAGSVVNAFKRRSAEHHQLANSACPGLFIKSIAWPDVKYYVPVPPWPVVIKNQCCSAFLHPVYKCIKLLLHSSQFKRKKGKRQFVKEAKTDGWYKFKFWPTGHCVNGPYDNYHRVLD